MSKSEPNQYDILGIGAPFLDHILTVSDEFLTKIPGAKGGMEPVDYKSFLQILENSGSAVNLAGGGSSANTIKGLAQLGHRCALLGKIGNDQAGKTFLEEIKKLNIVPLLLPSSLATGQVLCLVTPDGQRTFRDYLGAGQEMQASDLKPAHFEGTKLVHIEGYTLMNEPLTQRAMELAKEARAKISFDLASFELAEHYKTQIVHLVAHHVDVLFANVDETRTLTGHEPKKGCAILKDLCGIAVVMMGKEGCWVGHEDQIMHFPAYPVEPLDTTGAGDLFAAGFLHGYLEGRSLRECAHYGALAAAEVVQIFGAAIPDETWEKLRKDIPQKRN
jgi:sugar/nucleoside kinase (ribokinase family)